MLKIDVERAEWQVLRDIILHPDTVHNVKQLLFEAHTPYFVGEQAGPMSIQDFSQLYRVMAGIKTVGFSNFMHHAEDVFGGCCSQLQEFVPKSVSGTETLCCYEVFHVNSRFLNTTTGDKKRNKRQSIHR